MLIASSELNIRPFEWSLMEMRDVASVVVACRRIQRERAKEADPDGREPTKGMNVRSMWEGRRGDRESSGG